MHASSVPIVHVAPDTWLNVALGVAAVVTTLGIVVSALFTAGYGRRASVSVKAEAQRTVQSCAVIVRPSIKAVGVFKVFFERCVVKVAEVRVDANGQFLADDPFVAPEIFQTAFVVGGEELQTSVFVNVQQPAPSAVAWIARFEATACPRFPHLFPWRKVCGWVGKSPVLPPELTKRLRDVAARRFNWSDEVFVPVPRIEP